MNNQFIPKAIQNELIERQSVANEFTNVKVIPPASPVKTYNTFAILSLCLSLGLTAGIIILNSLGLISQN